MFLYADRIRGFFLVHTTHRCVNKNLNKHNMGGYVNVFDLFLTGLDLHMKRLKPYFPLGTILS